MLNSATVLPDCGFYSQQSLVIFFGLKLRIKCQYLEKNFPNYFSLISCQTKKKSTYLNVAAVSKREVYLVCFCLLGASREGNKANS